MFMFIKISVLKLKCDLIAALQKVQLILTKLASFNGG